MIIRSWLFVPGDSERKLAKGRANSADALILDLEDAVAPSEKEKARDLVADAVDKGGYGERKLIIRVNEMQTMWGPDDLRMASGARADAILVPKVETAAEVHAIEGVMTVAGAPDHAKIWVMMETPLAMLNAAEIAAASPRLAGFVIGTNDLVKELNAAHTPDRMPILTSLSLCLLAARAHKLLCLDGVYNAFKDVDGLREACIQGRKMGFDGKTLIHPAQIAVTNEVFAPKPTEVDLARRQVEAFEEASARGEAVAVVDGKLVENLHVESAKRVIGMSDAISRLEAALAEQQ